MYKEPIMMDSVPISDPKRRALLQALAAVGLTAPLLTPARAAIPQNAWRSAFEAYDGPFNARFNGVLESDNLKIEGRLPAALRGSLYRNGPARMRLGGTFYNHWFDGDGMVQAFRLADGKASHRGVLLRTPKLVEEEAAGRFLYSAFGTTFTDVRVVRNPDALNVANINLLPMNGGRDLYALWEGGSALKIDPQTLAAQGFKVWSPETTGASFSAHPRVAPDGTVWNFGYLPGSGKLLIYEIAASGRLKRQALLDAPQADMVHDFAITERHLVFLLMPLAFKRRETPGASFLDQFRWQSDAPLLAMLVDKSDFSMRRFELPNGGVFHLGNAWEEGQVVRLGYARHPDILATMHGQRTGGAEAPDSAAPRWMEVELYRASGQGRQHEVGLTAVEFPRFDARFTGQKTGMTVMMQRTAAMASSVHGVNSVLALCDGKIERYMYGDGWIAEEHIYIPHVGAGKDGRGWILGTAYHWPSERTVLSLFDAQRLAQGPAARVHLPYGLPLGLHGQFVSA
jgi:all-trans-8'-apo-beta-carotenal 15,15'-oxygenase